MAGITEAAEMQTLKAKMVFTRQHLRKGFIVFLLLTVSGLTIVFFATQTPETLKTFHHLNGRFFWIAIALAVLDMLVGGWRNHIFVRKVKEGASPWLSVRANLANVFLGAVTPASSGGGAALLFIFHRGGVSLSSSLPIAMINFISTMFFFLAAGLIATLLMPNQISSDLSTYLLRSIIILVTGLLILYLCLLWRPALLGRVVERFARLVSYLNRRWGMAILELSKKLLREVDKFQACCQYFLRRNPRLLLYSLGLTILLYLNKLTIGYCLLRGLGIEVDYLSVMIVQLIILISLYFSPSPGGSGLAELSIATLMSGLVPGFVLSLYTPLHRLFLLYLPALLGSGVLLKALRNQAGNSCQKLPIARIDRRK